MPLTEKGKKIKRAMEKEYEEKKGEQVFYASQNKGAITGTHVERKKAGKPKTHHSCEMGSFHDKRSKL